MLVWDLWFTITTLVLRLCSALRVKWLFLATMHYLLHSYAIYCTLLLCATCRLRLWLPHLHTSADSLCSQSRWIQLTYRTALQQVKNVCRQFIHNSFKSLSLYIDECPTMTELIRFWGRSRRIIIPKEIGTSLVFCFWKMKLDQE